MEIKTCFLLSLLFLTLFIQYNPGLDIGYKGRKEKGLIGKGLPERFRHGQRYSALSDIIVENGRLGQKSGEITELTYLNNSINRNLHF